MQRIGVTITAACVALLLGCIVEAPGTTGDSQKIPGGNAVVSNQPPMQMQNGANFEDKIQVLGVKVEPGRAQPGETVKVTAFYKVLDTIPQDYMVFVHVEDVDGRMERMNVDHQPAGGAYPTSQWKKGETVQDAFNVYVPPGQNLRGLNVWMGFWYAPTDTRLQLKNPEQVRNDGRSRILLATIPIGF